MSSRSDDGGSTTWYAGPTGTFVASVYAGVTALAIAATAAEVSLLEAVEAVGPTAWLAAGLAVGGLLLLGLGVATRLGSVGVVLGALGLVAALPAVVVELVALEAIPDSAVAVDATVPLDVYLFAILGAAARLLSSFVVDVRDLVDREATALENADDRTYADVTESELVRLVVGLPAAAYLAVGVALVGELTTVVVPWGSQPRPIGVVAFVVGFFVRRAYETLGAVADRLLDPVRDDRTAGEVRLDRSDEQPGEHRTDRPARAGGTLLSTVMPGGGSGDGPAAEESPWYAGWHGTALFVVTSVVVALAATLTLEVAAADAALLVGCAVDENCVSIPLDVYLYAFLGGTGYVFTTLFVDVYRTTRSLVESVFRIPAGVVLAAGFDALLDPTGTGTAAVAFLVGLYVKVAVVRVDELGRLLFDRLRDLGRG